MGSCLSNPRTRHDPNPTQKPPDRNSVSKKQLGLPFNDETMDYISLRYSEYFERKYIQLCGGTDKNISREKMGSFYSYLGFSQTTISQLYQIFKKDEIVLTYDKFKMCSDAIINKDPKEESATLYQLYFNFMASGNTLTNAFNAEFSPYLTGVKSEIGPNGIMQLSGKDKSSEKIRELARILDKRTSAEDKKEAVSWISKNVDFKKFKRYFLEGGYQIDEQLAIRDFCIDQKSSPLKGDISIVSQRWCDKLIKYINHKYRIQNDYELEDQSLDIRSNLVKSKSRLQHASSTKDDQNHFSNFGKKLFRKQSQQVPTNNFFDSLELKKSDEMRVRLKDITEFQREYYPNQIDNSPLIGNFQWELKKNIRKDYDYQTLKVETFKRLLLCFGGGPRIQRRIVKGYIDLRPYFINLYRFVYNKERADGYLTQYQLAQFQSTEKVSAILLDKTKSNLCYHRNIGCDWKQFPTKNSEDKNKTIAEVFTETSFLIYMSFNDEKLFKEIYVENRGSKKPRIGDLYQTKTSSTMNAERSQVCVVDEHEQGYVKYVILNEAVHNTRRQRIIEFQQKFVKSVNGFKNTLMSKKMRAGISNLGNTCYMNACLQAMFSLEDNVCLFSNGVNKPQWKEFGQEMCNIYETIAVKKKSVFPIDFKTMFDREFTYFKGQQQHDAHQFLLHLLSQLEKENKKIFKQQFEGEVTNRNKCQSCQQSHEVTWPVTIVSAPLRDFDKKQVKIDYITDQTDIQTIVFNIEEEATIQEWKRQFEKASGARQYYLCEVENSDISRNFQDYSLSEQFRSLRIENHFLITAYEYKLFNSRSKLIPDEYNTYKDSLGVYYIVSVVKKESPLSSTTDMGGKIVTVRMKNKDFLDKTEVLQSDLLRYPEDFPRRQIFIKVINFDSQYDEKIGRPFIFRMLANYPISAIRQALEERIGKFGYYLRLADIGHPGLCMVCKSYCRNKMCFLHRENEYPFEWFEGRSDYVVVWDNATEYSHQIKRIKFQAKKSRISDSNMDNFNMAYKKLQETQMMKLDSCELCKRRNVSVEHSETISRWPNILIVHLKRFVFKEGELRKIHTKWQLEHTLYVQKNKYLLKGVILHIGVNANYGHYVTIDDDVKYDDELVGEMKYESIPPEQIYLLFYYRI